MGENLEISFQKEFSRLDRRPNKVLFLLFLVYSIFKGKSYRKHLVRTYFVCRLPEHSNLLSTENLPAIKVIINSVQKDFGKLPLVIAYAEANSLNPIKNIEIAVPSNQIDSCISALSKVMDSNKISVISEDLFLNPSIREKIKSAFPTRYGWVLQQFLTVDRVLKSDIPVLQVNSDTIILRKKAWLDLNGNQEIEVSSEYHEPYYLLLQKIGLDLKDSGASHITHHMLFQPSKFQLILRNLKISGVEDLLDLVIKNCDLRLDSPMCIEFELYAYGLLNFFAKNVSQVKFGNINVKMDLKSAQTELEKELSQYARRYNSVSMHSYLN